MTIAWGRIAALFLTLALWATMLIILPWWAVVGFVALSLFTMAVACRYAHPTDLETPHAQPNARAEDQAPHPDQGCPVLG